MQLISAFVIPFVESIISILATGEISIFWLVPVAEETGFSLALSETPKTGIVARRPISCSVVLSLKKSYNPRDSAANKKVDQL